RLISARSGLTSVLLNTLYGLGDSDVGPKMRSQMRLLPTSEYIYYVSSSTCKVVTNSNSEGRGKQHCFSYHHHQLFHIPPRFLPLAGPPSHYTVLV
ncbi:hypothetical protein EDB87DRAFT_1638599, partial [Lactarius vividus]